MIKITFPDNSVKEFNESITPLEIAKGLSSGLAKKAIIAKVNGEFYDMSREITSDATLEIITDVKGENDLLNHSCAHLLAQAIKELYPEACFGVGPAIEEGFYYDMDLKGVKLTEEDLTKIEKKMTQIVASGEMIKRHQFSKEEALAHFANDPYKTELINELPEGEVITVYEQGPYSDLCRGPHVSSVKFLKFFKLLSVSGAYWRGNSKNAMLQRVYGTCFSTKEELDNHLHILEERKKRDHRKLGKELELFMISDFGPGLPFWLPNGYKLRRILEDFWLDLHSKNGYVIVETPIMLSKELWETSGHWDHYHEDMYTVEADKDETYAIKPMNCPGAILVYKNSIHSYKDLPYRIAELGHVHRKEASGALNGLFRVRTFTQDDAHTLLTEDQIGDEIERILKIYDYVYSIFGLDYSIELSTRPEDNFIGDIAVWDKAEADLARVCKATGHSFKINPGDGAFYGPKLDFKLRDSMNRIWQCGTVQLDMQLPGRFDCTYIDEKGEKQTPVMIHRACFGSLERFIAIITENYGGAFPTWLTPIQVKIIPVSAEYHLDYANEVCEKLKLAGIRAELDSRDEKLGYRLREAQMKKIPYQLVIGDEEKNNGTVNVREYGQKDSRSVSVDAFVEEVVNKVKNLK